MNCMFTKGYTFDDVLLIPKYSAVVSRADVDLSVQLPRGISLGLPFVTANMKDVTGPEMAREISTLGGLAILHRFADEETLLKNWEDASHGSILEDAKTKRLDKRPGEIGVSLGIGPSELDMAAKYSELGCRIFCVDVAHGHHKSVKEFVQLLRKGFANALIIAGNVATKGGAEMLWEAGADIIKIGIGPGCFAAGTRVLMANGTYKNIEGIKPGDRVINKNGEPKNVLKSFSTGTRKVSKVRNSIFYKDTYVTHDHKYFVGDLDSVSNETLQSQGYAKTLGKFKKNRDSKFGWQEIGTQTKKCLLMPRNIKFELPESFYNEIKIRDGGNGHSSIKEKTDFTIKATYSAGYIFGTFLGDGHAMLANNGANKHWSGALVFWKA